MLSKYHWLTYTSFQYCSLSGIGLLVASLPGTDQVRKCVSTSSSVLLTLRRPPSQHHGFPQSSLGSCWGISDLSLYRWLSYLFSEATMNTTGIPQVCVSRKHLSLSSIQSLVYSLISVTNTNTTLCLGLCWIPGIQRCVKQGSKSIREGRH